MARLVRSAAGQHLDFEAVGQRLAAFLFDRLALARIERGEKIVEIAIAVVGPVELLADALQETGLGQRLGVRAARGR